MTQPLQPGERSVAERALGLDPGYEMTRVQRNAVLAHVRDAQRELLTARTTLLYVGCTPKHPLCSRLDGLASSLDRLFMDTREVMKEWPIVPPTTDSPSTEAST